VTFPSLSEKRGQVINLIILCLTGTSGTLFGGFWAVSAAVSWFGGGGGGGGFWGGVLLARPRGGGGGGVFGFGGGG